MLVNSGFESFTVNRLAKACNISIATIYIYYKDKDDLIIKIACEELGKMRMAIIEDFDPDAGFENGLRAQWKNRYDYLMAHPAMSLFVEQLRASSYQDKIYTGFRDDYNNIINKFMHNAVAKGELAQMPVEVYWSVAFAPLQALIRAHFEGARPGGTSFKLTEKIVWQAFELVVKALSIGGANHQKAL